MSTLRLPPDTGKSLAHKASSPPQNAVKDTGVLMTKLEPDGASDIRVTALSHSLRSLTSCGQNHVGARGSKRHCTPQIVHKTCLHAHLHTCTPAHGSAHTHPCTYTPAYMHTCTPLSTHSCTHTLYTCIHAHVDTHTFTPSELHTHKFHTRNLHAHLPI